MKTFNQLLVVLDACSEARLFAKNYTLAEDVIFNCERGDWLLWLAKKLDMDIRLLTLAKVHCARTVQHLMKDERSLKALDVAEKFANGEATFEELGEARVLALDAAAVAAAAAAAAADAAADAGAGAAAAGAGAAAYADAAAGAYPGAARTKNRKQTADICRKYIGAELLKLVNDKLR